MHNRDRRSSLLLALLVGALLSVPTGTGWAGSLNDDLRQRQQNISGSERILLQSPEGMSSRVLQGATFVKETRQWYHFLIRGKNWDEQSITMVRSDQAGAVLDSAQEEQSTLGHGQDLNYFMSDGVPHFLTQNREGDGLTVFTYPRSPGGRIENVRQFRLSDAGSNHHTTIGLSRDKRFLLASFGNPADKQTYVRIFDLRKLIQGPPGDRRRAFKSEFHLAALDRNRQDGLNRFPLQSMTMDGDFIIAMNGDWRISNQKIIYGFSKSDGSLAWQYELTAGRGFAATMGKGDLYEPESLVWVSDDTGVRPFVGIRTRGSPYANWVLPMFERSSGAR